MRRGDGEIRRTEGGGARRARREDEAGDGAGVCAEWLSREGDGRRRIAGVMGQGGEWRTDNPEGHGDMPAYANWICWG